MLGVHGSPCERIQHLHRDKTLCDYIRFNMFLESHKNEKAACCDKRLSKQEKFFYPIRIFLMFS